MDHDIVVREHRARALDDEFLLRWEELRVTSLEPNPFLSSSFVLPALRHLESESQRDPMVVTLESAGDGRLLGLGIFETSSGTSLLPLRHLRSWKSIHSFLDGMILHRDCAHEVATSFFRWLQTQRDRWHGVSFRDRAGNSEQAMCLDNAARDLGIPWREDWGATRAAIETDLIPDEPLRGLYRSKHRKELGRRYRILTASGPSDFRMKDSKDEDADALGAFLRLEGMGWKGDEGTALISTPGQERFVREMVAAFAEVGDVFLPALWVNGERVAMGLVLRDRDTLFTLKSGYDTRRSRGSPGVALKTEFLKHLRTMPGIAMVDSCAVPGSWVERLWPWRKRVTRGVFPTTAMARAVTGVAIRAKGWKRRLTRGLDHR